MSRGWAIAITIAVLIALGMCITANQACSFPWQDCYEERE